MIKTVHLNSYDNVGGAARAAYRMHMGLKAIHVDSTMLVQQKQSDDPTVIGPTSLYRKRLAKVRPIINKLPLLLYPEREKANFSPSFLPGLSAAKVEDMGPDIIHLHWVNDGFMRIETLSKFNQPLVWTLYDMWPFTGGCHYDEDCANYENKCGRCPQLGSEKQKDLSSKILKRKIKAWGNLNLTVVAPSRWLAHCARSSTIFKNIRTEVIPYGLDTEIFKPEGVKKARNFLSLPMDKRLILFGAINVLDDKRKGFKFLEEALKKLSERGEEEVEVVVFGSSKPIIPPNFGLKTHYAGCLHDDKKLALLYSAADVMVVPSTQEAFGQTASESLACGTPVVAFSATGLFDIVEHKKNGYLAKPFDTSELASGIEWILEDSERNKKLGEAAREKAVKEYSLEMQANRYLKLYEELLGNG